MGNLDKKPSDFKKKNNDSGDDEKDKKPSPFGGKDDSGGNDSNDKSSGKPSFGRDGESDDNDASAKQDGDEADGRPGEGERDNPDDTENGRPGEGGEDQDGDGEDDERTSHQKIRDGDAKDNDSAGASGDDAPITLGDLKALIASKGGSTGDEEGKPAGQTDTGLKSSVIDTKPKVESFASWRDSAKG